MSEVAQSCLTLCDPVDCSLPGFSIHRILQQEYWSGLPFPSSGDLPDPGIKPRSPALKADALTSEPNFCHLRWSSKTKINFLLLLYNFMDRRFILTKDMSNLSTLFFSFLIKLRTSTLHIEELFSFSLAYTNCQCHYPCPLRGII